jgi:choline dehydrogenase
MTMRRRGGRSDGTTRPVIDPGYLTEPDDLAILVAGVRQARAIAGVGPLGELTDGEHAPGEAIRDDDEIAAWIRANLITAFHPAGTCAMGGRHETPCDPQLRVRGVDGLRVADASVMPVLPRGNTNAPTIAIGERAADLIRS